MGALTQPRKVVLEGKGTLTLNPTQYVTSGGEGAIYRIGNLIVKLYADPEKMRRDGMVEKIALLAKLRHPSIVSPEGIVRKSSGDPIGFYMQFTDGEPLSRVFTNDFRQREGFTDEMAQVLVARMHETVRYAHGNGALMIDANELNWLAGVRGAQGPEPHVIDVDSWAIGKYGASVIMPSIRDWHTKGFSTASDWFAWGVVTFQVFTGIHPYKGRLDGFGPGDLEQRMKANKSVFASGVRLNRAVRDFSVIPTPLCSWYEETFESNVRKDPPSPFDKVSTTGNRRVIMRVATTGTGVLVFEKIYGDTADPVVRVWPSGVALRKNGTLIDLRTKRMIGKVSAQGCEVVKVDGGWLVGKATTGVLTLDYIAEATALTERLTLPLSAQALFRSDNRLFAITERGITELSLRLFGKPILAVGSSWGASIASTTFYEGVGVYDALGAKFLLLPFADGACAIVRAPELDGRTLVTAKAGSRFVAVMVMNKSGVYERLEFTFDREHNSYAFHQTAVDAPELNMTILPKGVVASIVDDGELVILVPSSGQVAKVADKYITTDIELTRWEDQVLYIKEGVVWSVKMK